MQTVLNKNAQKIVNYLCSNRKIRKINSTYKCNILQFMTFQKLKNPANTKRPKNKSKINHVFKLYHNNKISNKNYHFNKKTLKNAN